MASRKLTLEAAVRLIKENDETLTNLDLSDTNIGDVGAVALAFALKNNNFITELYLMNANVGPSGANKLAGMLKVNYTLERLYLQSNTIGDKGAEALSSALKENISLRLLNLARCEIGDIGGASLAEGLLENEALHKLYLYNNNIGNIGAAALAEVVKENTTLQELFLWENNIKDEGLETLRRAYDSVVTDGRKLQLKTRWKVNEVSRGSQVSKPAPKRAAPRAQMSRDLSKEKAAGGKEAAEEKKNDFKSKTSFLAKEQSKSMAQPKSPVREGSEKKLQQTNKPKSPVREGSSICKLQQTNKQDVTEDHEAVEESNFQLLTRALKGKVETCEEQSKAMAQKKSKGGPGSVPENGVKAKSKALATMFDKGKEQPKSSEQTTPHTSPKKNPKRPALPLTANMPSSAPAPDSSTANLQPESKIEAVEENESNFKLLTSALASKVDKVKEQSRPMAQDTSKGGVDKVADDSVKAKSKALATMFDSPKEQPRSMSQTKLEMKASSAELQRRASGSSRSQVPESSTGKLQLGYMEKATEDEDVIKGNKNGVKERAKALASLEKAKEESKPMAQNKSLSPVPTTESATGAKQKSQALAKMLIKREVPPTGLVQSKSQRGMGSEASGEKDVVEGNKNGVKERAKALALQEKAKEESKSMARNKSLSPAGPATGAKQKSQALARMLIKREVHPTGLAQDKSQNYLHSVASGEQDVVEPSKNGVKGRAKALALLEKAKEESKVMALSPVRPAGSVTGAKQKSQALAKMLVKREVHPTGLVQDKSQNSLRSVASGEQEVVEGNKNGVKERARALTLLEKTKEESEQNLSLSPLTPAGSATGAKQKSRALAKMLIKKEVHTPALVKDKSQNSLRSEASGEQDVVEPSKNGVRERAKALAFLEKVSPVPPAGSVTGAKQNSQALAKMLVKREVHPTGLVQGKSQNSLRSVASGEQDVVESSKNGVKDRAKALALLEKAKEESNLMAQNVSLSPAGSATGTKQKSQALAKMLVKREVQPTGLVQSKSQRGLGLEASEKQDVVEDNKNGVKDWAKALTKLQNAKRP
jgi:hypothetical protein